MKYRLFLLLLTGCLLCGCAGSTEPTEAPSETTAATTLPVQTTQVTQPTIPTTLPPETEPPDPLDVLMDQLTLREKVGQLFMVTPEALNPAENSNAVTEFSESLAQMLQEYPVGGLILFHQNIQSPEQLRALNYSIQCASKLPLFMGVDEEGGLVARLANHQAFDLPKYRNAAAVGASGDSNAALEMGRTIGAYLYDHEFNLNFAPVADVNTNPDNPVIGTRAFSDHPEIAAGMAAAMADGLNEQGIIAVYKHFPGHGDTAQDSHNGLAVSYKSPEEMALCEWLPFQTAGREDMIMVGHVAVPNITGDMTPATFSHQVITEILKEQLMFEGLVITDSMQMGAITNDYSSGEAAVLALQAGCDIILMPLELTEAFDAVIAALEDGTLTMEWLDATVRRILEFKRAHGLLHY